MVHQPHLNTRNVSLVMLAAFAAAGLWLFAPWSSFGGGGSSSGSGGSSGASASAKPSLHTDGAAQIDVQDNTVTHLVVPITVDGVSVRLPETAGVLRAETSLSESAAAAVPGTYSVNRLDGNGDDSLDPGEHAQLVVDLPSPSSVHPGNPLRLVIDTADGDRLPIEDVIR